MSDEKPKPPATFRGRALGGLRAASNMTPKERSERSRAASVARWARENERRVAAGEPPTRTSRTEPSAEDLEPWHDATDARWPDRTWKSGERRRQAIILWRTAAAEAASDAIKRREKS